MTEFERDLLQRVAKDEENRVVGRTWLRWRQSWDRKRKGRWEESLLTRETEVQGWAEDRLLRDALQVRCLFSCLAILLFSTRRLTFFFSFAAQHWRSLRLTLVATSRFEITTLRSTFNWWRGLASHLSSLEARERGWEVSSAERTKSSFFGAWKSEKLLKEQQRLTEDRVADRILMESWDTWKAAM